MSHGVCLQDRFLQADAQVLKARRSLFGEVDHAANKRKLQSLNAMLDKAAMDKWDFNFKEETPISKPRRFQWEKVEDDVPAAYMMPGLGRACCSRFQEIAKEATFRPISHRTCSPVPLGEVNADTTPTASPVPCSASAPSRETSENTPCPCPKQPAERSQTAQSSTTSSSSSSVSTSRKRKLSERTGQTKINEYFKQRKSSSVVSAKRRLDL